MRLAFLRRKRDAAARDRGDAGAPPKLVVGLGNPGGRYLATRHNVGFEVVEVIAARAGAQFRRGKFRCAQAEARLGDARVILIEPHTFMNRSGLTVGAALDYYKAPMTSLLVICDDVHLPLGRIRLRRSGSAGGHNGLDSIVQALGSTEFPRLRVGVGEPPPHMDQVSYVLSHFAASEREEAGAAIARAAEAVEAWVAEGIEAAMNRFN